MDHELRNQKRTAFALDETDPQEYAQNAAEFGSQGDRLAIEETRQLGAFLREALATEESPGLSEIHRLAVETQLQRLGAASEEAQRAHRARQRLAFWIPTSLAACAMIASGVALILTSLPWPGDNPRPGGNGAAVEGGDVNPIGGGPRTDVPPNPVNLVQAEFMKQRAAFLDMPVPMFAGPALQAIVGDDDAASQVFHPVSMNPVCTMPLTVDTESAAYVRRFVNEGSLPPKETVFLESLLNSFDYKDEKPVLESGPMRVFIEIGQCPWRLSHRLARVTVRTASGADAKDTDAIVAQGVRMRVEFNPGRVQAYRLIGYDNRYEGLAPGAPDDGTDLRGGHAVTMLYEIMPTPGAPRSEELGEGVVGLRYQMPRRLTAAAMTTELFHVELRYQAAGSATATAASALGVDPGLAIERASPEFKFAAAVAAFGLVLTDAPGRGGVDFEAIRDLAGQGVGHFAREQRIEFINLVSDAQRIAQRGT